MIREHIFSGRTPTDPQFRWRGGDISRIEGLSDAAFAFAMTMLVVDTFQSMYRYEDVIHNMAQVPALVACFAILIWIWAVHYQFFRRFGLEDGFTIFLNSSLLFAVMVYVYPLKFIFTYVVNVLVLRRLPVDAATGETFDPMQNADSMLLMQLYGVGYIVIFLLLALMVHHAYRKRLELELDELEVLLTIGSRTAHLLAMSVGVLSIGITFLAPWIGYGLASGLAGLIYGLNGPVLWIHGSRLAKGVTALEATLRPSEPTSTAS